MSTPTRLMVLVPLRILGLRPMIVMAQDRSRGILYLNKEVDMKLP
jgi:hypothetical protein